jgi:bifunctional enzyme CysN/CysC
VRELPSGKETQVQGAPTMEGNLDRAVVRQSMTFEPTDGLDSSRGDLAVTAEASASLADQFEAALVWMQDEPLFPGRQYLMQIGAQTVTATVTDIKCHLNASTMERLAARRLELNDIAICNVALDRVISLDPDAENRETGSFVLIDRVSNRTAGAGTLHFALGRARNIRAQHVDVDKDARSTMKRQKACVLWFTGLSGAGKSTISNLVEKRLHQLGKHTYLLDGDNLRLGLNSDLGFTDADRVENIRRVAEVAKLMVDAGLIVLAAFISPFKAERELARALVRDGEFIEIYVDTPLWVAEQRDRKGLYEKARRGELMNFTGIDSPYEVPGAPELRLSGAATPADALADQVLAFMRERGLLVG